MKKIIHFWNVPRKSNFIVLNDFFLERFVSELWDYSQHELKKLTGVSPSVICRIRNLKIKKIRIDHLLSLNNFLKYSLKEIEKNIEWIGALNSQGIINPALPFKFNSRQAARFLAAICNEGWISDGMYYSNFDKELRDSVKNDTLYVFGGDNETVKEWIKEKDKYLSFPSIIRDVFLKIIFIKGAKAETNPDIPSFIVKNRKLSLGWIEQTIADEGCVKHYPEVYRREVSWNRSISSEHTTCKFIEKERKMLNSLNIYFNLYNSETYTTKLGRKRKKLRIIISRKNNLAKLNNLISIPCSRKRNTLTEISKSY